MLKKVQPRAAWSAWIILGATGVVNYFVLLLDYIEGDWALKNRLLGGYEQEFLANKLLLLLVAVAAATSVYWLVNLGQSDSEDGNSLLIYAATFIAAGLTVIALLKFIQNWPPRQTSPKVQVNRKKELVSQDHDDLTQIAGIGSKIESLLNQHEISSYSQLAITEVAELQRILEQASDSYRLKEAESWPSQASRLSNK